MKMSIARALKERKRLIGEMNTLRSRIADSNTVEITVKYKDDGTYDMPTSEEFARKRKVYPSKLMEEWYKLRTKLISLKTKLQEANIGIASKLVEISELKAELAGIEGTPMHDSNTMPYSEKFVRIVDVVFDSAWKTAKIDELRKAINQLQDDIDEYNATHYIEVAD